MNKNSKALIYLSLIVILGVGSFYLYKYYDKVKKSTKNVVNNQVEDITNTENSSNPKIIGGRVIKVESDKVYIEFPDDQGQPIEKEYVLSESTKYKTTGDSGVYISAKKEDIKKDIDLLVTLKDDTNQVIEAEILKP